MTLTSHVESLGTAPPHQRCPPTWLHPHATCQWIFRPSRGHSVPGSALKKNLGNFYRKVQGEHGISKTFLQCRPTYAYDYNAICFVSRIARRRTITNRGWICEPCSTLLLGSYFGLWHPFTSFSLPNSLPFLDLKLKGGVFASIKSGQRHVDGSHCCDKAQQRNNKRHGVFDPGNRIVKRPVRCKEVQQKVSKKRSGKG